MQLIQWRQKVYIKKKKEDVNMNVDEVIELENGHNYLLLLKSILDG